MVSKIKMFLVLSLISTFILILSIEEVSSFRTKQTLRKLNTQKSIDLMFTNVGTYSGKSEDGQFYIKQYYVPNFFRVYWHEVKGICSQYGMEVATFETKEESEKILDILRENGTDSVEKWDSYFVGAVNTVPKSKTDWFWADSGEHIDFDFQWMTNQPDNARGVEFCLAIIKSLLIYNDVPCDSYYPDLNYLYYPKSFICQKKKVLCDVKN